MNVQIISVEFALITNRIRTKACEEEEKHAVGSWRAVELIVSVDSNCDLEDSSLYLR